MAKGRDKRKRAAKRIAAQRRLLPVKPDDPPIVDDPEALVGTPRKPKPHSRSGAVALLEPDDSEETRAVAEAKIRIGEIAGDPIVGRIKAAFATTEYPGDDAFPLRSIDEEPEKLRYLMSRSWQDLELEAMPGLSDVLMWLSPEGLRYFLPAFLIAAVTLQEIPGSFDVIGFLAPPGRQDPGRSSFLHFVKDLTGDQKNAIRDCLRHLRIDTKGIYGYWVL